ncbi:MAG: hypothetical protein IPF81_02980 [Bacteroidetes bacterium]|nr:hypothetical protein [Bacteroidota bacterium]
MIQSNIILHANTIGTLQLEVKMDKWSEIPRWWRVSGLLVSPEILFVME